MISNSFKVIYYKNRLISRDFFKNHLLHYTGLQSYLAQYSTRYLYTMANNLENNSPYYYLPPNPTDEEGTTIPLTEEMPAIRATTPEIENELATGILAEYPDIMDDQIDPVLRDNQSYRCKCIRLGTCVCSPDCKSYNQSKILPTSSARTNKRTINKTTNRKGIDRLKSNHTSYTEDIEISQYPREVLGSDKTIKGYETGWCLGAAIAILDENSYCQPL